MHVLVALNRNAQLNFSLGVMILGVVQSAMREYISVLPSLVLASCAFSDDQELSYFNASWNSKREERRVGLAVYFVPCSPCVSTAIIVLVLSVDAMRHR